MKKIRFIIILLLLIASNTLQAQNDMLDKQQEKIITISALTAQGDLERLRPELISGLDAGLTVNEIKEVLVHLYAYCGFPRSLQGLQTFMLVLEERKAAGIVDEQGREASPIIDTRDKYERGKEVLAELQAEPAPEGKPTNGYGAFSPEIDTFLKEHLFADIFERDVLTYAQREMVTVSVLMALGGVEPMLESHMNLALNVGVTADQLGEMIELIENNVVTEKADTARLILAKVLESRNLN